VNALWAGVALVTALVVATALAAVAVRAAPPSLRVANRAGRVVPVVLGLAMVPAFEAGVLPGLALGRGDPTGAGPVVALSLGILALAGLVDDAVGGHARGFGGHLGSLARGRPTTGILKLGVGVALAVWLAVAVGGEPLRVVAAAVLIAASINVWNALDVAPGRALKWGIVVLAAVLVGGFDRPAGILAAAGLGAAVGVLPFDLRERGMLGDAGSNPLGLLAGVGLALVLPTWGVVGAAAAVLGLQVAAETVTISRLIDATPPVRWFDRAGRRM
jgi:hypothetical protein